LYAYSSMAMGVDISSAVRDKAEVELSAAQFLCAKAVLHSEPMVYVAPGAQVHDRCDCMSGTQRMVAEDSCASRDRHL
jgi:hypothetical protein